MLVLATDHHVQEGNSLVNLNQTTQYDKYQKLISHHYQQNIPLK